MKIIRYTLLSNGKVPEAMFDGGYFPKPNGEQSPQDYDLIGYTYDRVNDIFLPPKHYDSFVLNKNTASWEAPSKLRHMTEATQ